MTPSEAFAELGLARAGADRRAVRSAYAKRLKVVRPEEDPEGFMRLRAAYELARRIAPDGKRAAAEDPAKAAPAPEPSPAPSPEPAPDAPPPPPRDEAPPPPPATPATAHPAGLDAPWDEPSPADADAQPMPARRRLQRAADAVLGGADDAPDKARDAEERAPALRRAAGRDLLSRLYQEDDWNAFASPWTGGSAAPPRSLTLAQAEALNRMFRFDRDRSETLNDAMLSAYWRAIAAALEEAHGPDALPPALDLRALNARARADAEARKVDYFDQAERKMIAFAPASRAMEAIRGMDDAARADPAEWVKILDAPYIETLDDVERLGPPLRLWLAQQTGYEPYAKEVPSPIPVPAWLTPEVLTVIDRRYGVGRARSVHDRGPLTRHLAALCAALLEPAQAEVQWRAAATRTRWKPPFYATWSGLLIAYAAFRLYQLI
ncbi:hypothetical protein ACQ5SO_07705 [Rhodovulum sp. DZ06]|uniref:hypothetical protein n=1 Tax=Rhodovulum sp. DZ06 TaxID=3425126 RepID=UPI003D3354E4